ncbi:DUF4190 domain-containing protein [Micromonospora cathayae]|uniref:DUF4190 domain-containing protein n=1 Tax=Micromonospora cathayae TaxID=3028804 RepID=A0ABY7ZUE4_9ACTN|nr:DUF4190 domain-containing protein [Micromonospora sp. HUAS 3]WDZ86659.1 DUF4190 domain-containing protein [Micromonospora sp. HUAS 3]
MTYPSPDDAWQDPARAGQPSAPPVDPTRPTTDPPPPEQPYGGDPHPYAQPGGEVPYAQPVGKTPYGQPGGDPYAMGGYATPGYPPPGYPPMGYPAYPYPPVRRTNSMALAALILSLVGIASCLTAPVGAILGHVARKQIRETGEDGEGMAKAAIIVGWVLTGLLVLAIVFYIVVIVFAISESSSTSY